MSFTVILTWGQNESLVLLRLLSLQTLHPEWRRNKSQSLLKVFRLSSLCFQGTEFFSKTSKERQYCYQHRRRRQTWLSFLSWAVVFWHFIQKHFKGHFFFEIFTMLNEVIFPHIRNILSYLTHIQKSNVCSSLISKTAIITKIAKDLKHVEHLFYTKNYAT